MIVVRVVDALLTAFGSVVDDLFAHFDLVIDHIFVDIGPMIVHLSCCNPVGTLYFDGVSIS